LVVLELLWDPGTESAERTDSAAPGIFSSRADNSPARPTEKRKAMKSLMMRHTACLLLAGLVLTVFSAKAPAQVFEQDIAGVEIAPDGVLRMQQVDPRVGQARLEAARRDLDAELARRSPLRKVSLNRLEAALAARLEAGEEPTAAMRAVAGLTSVDYVFFYPESGDVVVAGPAEGFFEDAAGRLRGIETGLPTLRLEDLVTALRAYPPQQRGTGIISVSIDPTEEGLRRLNEAMRQVANVRRGNELQIAKFLKNNLGLQTVSIRGVPAGTHFARVLVEADYRMKLIGIGLERLPNGMASFTERSLRGRGSASAMERWYFEPNYDCVTVSEDGLGMSLSGDGVRLVGAAELVTAKGERKGRAQANPASEAFCEDFTDKYAEIAASVPVYAQLRNLIDLSIAAAFIQKQDYATHAGWEMELLLDESRLPVETHTAPHQVETAVNAVWKGNQLLTPIGGGILMQPKKALAAEYISTDVEGRLMAPREQVAPAAADQRAWWWD
jgi:hypothetical protein